MAVLPSADSATDMPWRAAAATSLSPCWVQRPSLRVKTHAAPAAPRPKGTDRSHGLSPGPPTIAVLPSPDNATDMPWWALPTAPVPTSFLPCCGHRPPLRGKTHAARILPLPDNPPPTAAWPPAGRCTALLWPVVPPCPLLRRLLRCSASGPAP